MADSKITALTALTAADPANDMIPIVDVSDTPPASGNTKRISINNLLACSPSATLASATITGALGAAGLNVTGATIPANGVYLGSANNLSFSAASTLAMTLNSTGLGVGTSSPAAALDLTNTGITASREIRIENSAVRTFLGVEGSSGRFVGSATGNAYFGCSGAFGLEFATNNNVRMFVDTTGNVGIGVTPSAWSGTFRSLDIGSGALTSQPSQQTIGLYANAFENGTNYTRKALGFAAGYNIYNGAHYWLNAASGAAASTFAFGDAKMTLDASGNLILLSSNTPATLTTNGQLTVNATSNTNLRFSYRGSDGVTRVANITLA